MSGAVILAGLGDVEPALLAGIAQAAEQRLGVPADVGAPLALPREAWDVVRTGYNAWRILDALAAQRPRAGPHVLGVIDADVFFAPFTFIFGSARVSEGVGVIGLARLRPEFYGLPPDLQILQARALKEALHELGHTFGLMHCPNKRCVMASSPGLRGVDAKADEWCAACAAGLQRAIPAAMRGPPDERDASRRHVSD